MKQIVQTCMKREVLSLATGITFSTVPAWYEGTLRDLKMDLIIPKHRQGHAPRPAVVWICGGAYMVVNRSIWLAEMLRFARAGYTVASIEYRTSNEAQFPAQLIDVKAAIRYLKAHAQQLCIDPDRIIVMGESAGGALASLAGVTAKHKEYDVGEYLQYSSAVQAVVSFYGPSVYTVDVQQAEPSPDVPDWTYRAYLGANYTEETYRKACASSYLSDGDIPPFMLLQGLNDPLVPYALSDVFYDELVGHGVDVQYIQVEGAGHGDDLFYQDDMIRRVIRFIDGICGRGNA